MSGLPIIAYAVISYWAASKTIYSKSPPPHNVGELGSQCAIAMIFGWFLIPFMVIKENFPKKRSSVQNGEYDSSKSPNASAASTAPNNIIAAIISSTVLVNGVKTSFDAYKINNVHYFKLRDLAYALSGTEKQFDVGWDNTTKMITLTSGQRYTALGVEMAPPPSDIQSRSAMVSNVKLLVNGKELSLAAYKIDEVDYFKLRDIGKLLDFGIGWNKDTKTISIDTSTGYTV